MALVARFDSMVTGLGSDVYLKFQLFVLVCLSFGCWGFAFFFTVVVAEAVWV